MENFNKKLAVVISSSLLLVVMATIGVPYLTLFIDQPAPEAHMKKESAPEPYQPLVQERIIKELGQYGKVTTTNIQTPCPARSYPESWETSNCGGVLRLSAALPTIGLDIVSFSNETFQRTGPVAPLGAAWNFGFAHEIRRGPNYFDIIYAGGHSERYTDPDGDGKFKAEDKYISGYIVEVDSNNLAYHSGSVSVKNYVRFGTRYLLSNTKRGDVTTYEIDMLPNTGRIESITGEDGVTIYFEYYDNDLVKSISNPRGGKYEFVYEPRTFNLQRLIWPDGKEYTFGYANPYNLVTAFIAPSSTGSVINYAKHVVTDIFPGNGASPTRFDYSEPNKVKVYSGEEIVLSDTFANGALVKRNYDGNKYDLFERYTGGITDKLLRKYTSYTGNVTEYSYYTDSAKSKLVKTVKQYPQGAAPEQNHEVTYSYNSNAKPLAITTKAPNADGSSRTTKTVSISYKDNEYVTGIRPVGSGGSQLVVARDSNNAITSVTEKLGSTTLSVVTYDPATQKMVGAFDAISDSAVAMSYPDNNRVIVNTESEQLTMAKNFGDIVSIAANNSRTSQSFQYNEMGEVTGTKSTFPNGGYIRTESDITWGDNGAYLASSKSYYSSGQDCSGNACMASANFDVLNELLSSSDSESEYLQNSGSEKESGSKYVKYAPNATGSGGTTSTYCSKCNAGQCPVECKDDPKACGFPDPEDECESGDETKCKQVEDLSEEELKKICEEQGGCEEDTSGDQSRP